MGAGSFVPPPHENSLIENMAGAEMEDTLFSPYTTESK